MISASIVLLGSLLAVPGGTHAKQTIKITNDPSTKATTCENYTLTWEGGVPPYTVDIHYRSDVGQAGGALLELDQIFHNISTTSFTTKLNVPTNAVGDDGSVGVVRFGVWDDELDVDEFPLFNNNITAGDTSCLPMTSTTNDTTPEPPSTRFSLVGPAERIPECATSTFMTLGAFPGLPTALKLITLNLANNVELAIYNLLSTKVSLKLPFPAGTEFIAAAANDMDVAPDIQRTITAGNPACAP